MKGLGAVLVWLSVVCHAIHDGRERASDFSNEWIVNLEGDEQAADLVADTLGYENLGAVRILYRLFVTFCQTHNFC